MRNSLLTLLLLGAGLLAFGLLLPILGVLFIIVVVAIVAVVGLMLAAPFLARLPWFRDRIHIRRYGGSADVRSSHQSSTRIDQGDVIDVEGREIPTDEEKQG